MNSAGGFHAFLFGHDTALLQTMNRRTRKTNQIREQGYAYPRQYFCPVVNAMTRI